MNWRSSSETSTSSSGISGGSSGGRTIFCFFFPIGWMYETEVFLGFTVSQGVRQHTNL
ncbi:MAG: hypothetical protein ACTHKC_08620 [Candidatus Nitrosocosmicus sp.]